MGDEIMNINESDEAMLEARVSALETLCSSLSEQMSGISGQVSALSAQLSDFLSEEEYELRYAGEEVDEVCERVLALNYTAANINSAISKINSVSYSASQINSAVDKANSITYTAAQINKILAAMYGIYFKWGSYTGTYTYKADQALWWKTTYSDIIPSGASSVGVFFSCDWGGVKFPVATLNYTVNGRSITTEHRIHSDENSGSGTVKITTYYLIIYKA